MLRLEERDDEGRTDLEIEAGVHLVIIEAKRGWLLPGDFQLGKYAPRVAQHGSGVLVSLSSASADWAQQHLPAAVAGAPVLHLPWDQVRQDLAAARTAARGQERTWLDELSHYLRKAIRVLDPADSWAYCVSVSNARPGNGGSRTFRDFVTREGCYFHPHGWGMAADAAELPCGPLGQPGSAGPPGHQNRGHPQPADPLARYSRGRGHDSPPRAVPPRAAAARYPCPQRRKLPGLARLGPPRPPADQRDAAGRHRAKQDHSRRLTAPESVTFANGLDRASPAGVRDLARQRSAWTRDGSEAEIVQQYEGGCNDVGEFANGAA